MPMQRDLRNQADFQNQGVWEYGWSSRAAVPQAADGPAVGQQAINVGDGWALVLLHHYYGANRLQFLSV
jgi:hypothetical protein